MERPSFQERAGLSKEESETKSALERISLSEWRENFELRPERIEETKKVFSLNLKDALGNDASSASGRFMPARQGPWNIMSLRMFSRRPDVRAALNSDQEENRRFAVANFSPFRKYPHQYIALAYSTDERSAMSGGEWIHPDAVRYHGMYFATASVKDPLFLPLSMAEQNPELSADADPSKLEEALRVFETKDRVDCRPALEDVELYGKELGLDRRHIEALKKSIQDFSAYVKPEPKTPHERFCEVGRCFTVPGMFREYAKIMYGLNIDTDEYYREHGGHAQFYHQVNVLDKRLIVDWTAKQFSEFAEEHYPFVYPLGDARIQKSWGPLRRTQSEE